MIKIIESLISSMVQLLSFFYSYNFNQRIIKKRNSLYTIWISCFLGDVGNKVHFKYPLRLQGGNYSKISVGARTIIQSYSILGCWEQKQSEEQDDPIIVIGNDCNIGEFCHITAINKITIGDGLLAGRFVYIGDNSHGGLSFEEAKVPPAKRCLKSKGEIKIGNNVWLGDKVSVFGGVTIGDNVIIGAGSIVTHDIPSNSMAAGIPAKVIKQLNI